MTHGACPWPLGICDPPVLQQNKTTATVALVSPYKAHVQALTKWLAEKPGRFPSIEIQVKTVDGFQGRKTDIIIFSAVRANSAGKVGFLSDNRRLNVAITRAKYVRSFFGVLHASMRLPLNFKCVRAAKNADQSVVSQVLYVDCSK